MKGLSRIIGCCLACVFSWPAAAEEYRLSHAIIPVGEGWCAEAGETADSVTLKSNDSGAQVNVFIIYSPQGVGREARKRVEQVQWDLGREVESVTIGNFFGFVSKFSSDDSCVVYWHLYRGNHQLMIGYEDQCKSIDQFDIEGFVRSTRIVAKQ